MANESGNQTYKSGVLNSFGLSTLQLCKGLLLFATVSYCFALSVPAHARSSHYESALQEYKQGNIDEAYIHVKNAKQQDNDSLPVSILLAQILSDKALYEEAKEQFDLALSLKGDPNIFIDSLADTLLALTQFNQVANFEHFDQLSATNQRKWQLVMAKVCTLQADTRCALDLYQQLVGFDDVKIQALNGAALIYLIEKQEEKAIEMASKALLFEQNVESHRIIGQSNKSLGNYDSAIASLQTALELEPQNESVSRNLVDLMIAMNDLDSAWNSVARVLEGNPNDLFAVYTKAWIAKRQGQDEQSKTLIETLSATLSSFPKNEVEKLPWIQYLKGMIALLEDKHQVAQEELQRYLFLVDKDIDAALHLTQSFLASGNNRAALKLLSEYENQIVDYPNAALLLSQLYASNNQIHKSIRMQDALRGRFPNSQEVLLFDVQLDMIRGRDKSALDNLDALSMRFPDSIKIKRMQAMLASKRDVLRANKIALEILDSSPTDIEMLNIHGAYLMQSGEFQKARDVYDGALSIAPSDPQLLTNSASVYLLLNQTSRAFASVVNALNSDPSFLPAAIIKAKMLLNDEKAAEVIALLSPFVDKNTDSVDLHISLVDANAMIGNIEEVSRLVARLRVLSPDNISFRLQALWIDYRLGKVSSLLDSLSDFSLDKLQSVSDLMLVHQMYMIAGDNDTALKVLELAHQTQSDNIDLHLQWIKGLLSASRFDEAEKQINGLIANDPNSAKLSYTKAEVMQAIGQNKSAIELYQKALSQDSSFELALARIFVMLGNGISVSEFEVIISRMLDSGQSSYFVRNLFAQFHYYYGDLNVAKEQYVQLLNDPDVVNPKGILNRLGMITELSDITQSEIYYRRALDLEPNYLDALKGLGILLVENKRTEEGLSYLRSAYTLSSSDVDVLLGLATGLFDLNRVQEAKSHIETLKGLELPAYIVEKLSRLDA